jgi:hypothetical protein
MKKNEVLAVCDQKVTENWKRTNNGKLKAEIKETAKDCAWYVRRRKLSILFLVLAVLESLVLAASFFFPPTEAEKFLSQVECSAVSAVVFVCGGAIIALGFLGLVTLIYHPVGDTHLELASEWWTFKKVHGEALRTLISECRGKGRKVNALAMILQGKVSRLATETRKSQVMGLKKARRQRERFEKMYHLGGFLGINLDPESSYFPKQS